jgi:hypothetical protein
MDQKCDIAIGRRRVVVNIMVCQHVRSLAYFNCFVGPVNPNRGGPHHRSLYSNPHTGKDGTIHHTRCMPTHVEEWGRIHDGRRGYTVYDLGVCCKSTLWDPPNATTSASDLLQGPEYRTSDVVRHAGSIEREMCPGAISKYFGD